MPLNTLFFILFFLPFMHVFYGVCYQDRVFDIVNAVLNAVKTNKQKKKAFVYSIDRQFIYSIILTLLACHKNVSLRTRQSVYFLFLQSSLQGLHTTILRKKMQSRSCGAIIYLFEDGWNGKRWAELWHIFTCCDRHLHIITSQLTVRITTNTSHNLHELSVTTLLCLNILQKKL